MEKQIEILKSFENEFWITKSGDKIRIKDLELSHLKNIVKHLKKRFDDLENPLNDYPCFQGEMAQMYAEQEWERYSKLYHNFERRLRLFECYYMIKSMIA